MSTDTMTSVGTMHLTMTAKDVTAALAWVSVGASKDATLPVITGVHMSYGTDHPHHYGDRHQTVRHEGYGVTFAATDRYILTHATVPVGGNVSGDESGSVLLPAKELAAAVKAWPKAGRSGQDNEITFEITFTPAGVPLSVSVECLVMGQPATTHVLRPIMGEFPKFRQLLPDFTDSATSPIGMALDATRVSDVARAAVKASGNKRVVVSMRAAGSQDEYARKPVALAVSNADSPVYLSGLLMPVRLAS